MTRVMRVLMAALAAILILLQTGCWNMREVEHMFYAHGTGVEFKDGKYTVYVQILDFTTLGKQEGGASSGLSQGGSWVGNGTGNSIQAAIHDLYATAQRRIFWGHLNAIVIGESLLQQDLREFIDIVTRYHEFRYTMWIFGTRQSVKDVMLASPILEASPLYSQFGDPQDVFNQSSFIPPMRFYRFIRDLQEPGRTALLPMLALNKGHWADLKTEFPVVEIEGAASLKDWELKGFFSRDRLVGMRWLYPNATRIPLEIRSGDKTLANLVFGAPKHRIIPEVKNGRAKFRIQLTMGGTIAHMDKTITVDEIKDRAQQVIIDEIRLTYFYGLEKKVDILNLTDALYRKHVREWRKMQEEGKFPLDKNSLESIEVEVVLTDGGRAMAPPD